MASRDRSGGPGGDALPSARPNRAPAVERHRYEVRRIDIWSVVRTALLFNVAALAVIVVAAVVVWLVAAALGAISGLENFLGSLLSAKDFRFASLQILDGFGLVGLVLVALTTVLVTVAAGIYNLFAEWTGGIELILVEEDDA